MTIEQILENTTQKPKFKFTTDLYAVIEDMLSPDDIYFSNLRQKIIEIIDKEIAYAKHISGTIIYEITFDNVEKAQKILFDYMKQVIEQTLEGEGDLAIISETRDEHYYLKIKLNSLLNQHMNLGLRKTNVNTDTCIFPKPEYLEGLKDMCFPISEDSFDYLRDSTDETTFDLFDENVKTHLTQWYSMFQSIRYFERLNNILGYIVINIFSYILTEKYLIKTINND